MQTSNPASQVPQSKPSAWQRANPVTRSLVVVGSLLGIALLVLSFFGGVFVGQARAERKVGRLEFAKRQLTENLDRPIKQRPLLQGPGMLGQQIKEHGLRGTVVEVEEDALLVDTPDGPQSIALAAETKYVSGKDREPVDRDQLKPGVHVLVLTKQEAAAVVVVNPPQDGPRP